MALLGFLGQSLWVPQPRLALDVLAILAAAALAVLGLRRFPAATIPGYLLAGALIGPHALGLVGYGEQSQSAWQFATVLLLFTIGLQLDPAGVRGGVVPTLAVGFAGTLAFVLTGWPVAWLLGIPAPGALAVVMALAMSSTAVVLRLLEQRRELHRLHGRICFGASLAQDLMVLGVMPLIPLLAIWAGGTARLMLPDVGTVLLRIGAIAGIVVLGRLVFPRMLTAAAWSPEVLLVVSAAVALGAAVATASLGFSPELGAFLAGFLLAGTPFRYQLAGQLVPLRDLFLAVFFTALGLELDPVVVLEGWGVVLIGTLALLGIKGGVLALMAWAAGVSAPVALTVGAALFQAGEFSLVLLAQARHQGAVYPDHAALATAVVVLSLVLTPAVMWWGRRLANALRTVPPAPWARRHVDDLASGPDDAPPREEPRPVTRAIVAGFGPVGRAVADALERQDVHVTVIELNPRTVSRQQALGRAIVYGDASNRGVLERAGLAQADAVILTMPDEDAVMRACRLIRLARPDIFIAARVNTLARALEARQLGADHALAEELAMAQVMAVDLLSWLVRRRETVTVPSSSPP